MSLEILDSIRQAESKAEEIRTNAQREARDMLKGTEAACNQQERSAAVQHRALYQQLMDASRVLVEQELAKKSAQEGKARLAMCQEAEKRLDKAATMIVERIVSHGDR